MKMRFGFTLIELLVALAILVSLTAVAVPNLTDFTVKLRVDNEITAISRLLLVARNTAINANQTVTLCPLDSAKKCSNNWHNDISVFTDLNANKQVDLNDKVISIKAGVNNGDKLQYGKTRKGLTYASTGHLSGWGQNATFKYCPKHHADKSRGIVVAVSGRIYRSFNNSTSLLDKNRSGRKIICH